MVKILLTIIVVDMLNHDEGVCNGKSKHEENHASGPERLLGFIWRPLGLGTIKTTKAH